MSAIGLRATELGPAGYLPAEPDRLQAILEAHDLRLVAAFVPLVLHEAGAGRASLAEIDSMAGTLAELGAEFVVVAPVVDLEWSPRVTLTERQWRRLCDGLSATADRAVVNGVTAALHPHAGSLVETAAEVERVLARSDIGICLDTGHFIIGGLDPVEFARAVGERVVHVHLKDVDAQLARRVGAGELTMAEAVRRGLCVPLGDGDAGIADVFRLLDARGYDGWLVLEQDTALASEPGRDRAGPAASVRRSIEFLDQLIGTNERGGSPLAEPVRDTARP
jgi:inosose dehydratase